MSPTFNQILHFVLALDWTILAHNDVARRFWAEEASLVGLNLRGILLSLNPDWTEMLEHTFSAPVRRGVYLRGRHENSPAFHLSGIPIPDTPERCTAILEPSGNFFRETEDGVESGPDPREVGQVPVGKILPLLKDRAVLYRQSHDLKETHLSEGGAAFLQGSHDFMERVHPEDREILQRAMNERRARDEWIRLQYRLMPTDGSVRHLIDFRRILRTQDETVIGFDGVWLDVTREVLTDRRLQQAEWQESLYLAMRVLLHDFNNAVTGMYVLLESVQEIAEADPDNREMVSTIRERTDQTATLIRQIAILNQKKIGALTPCCVAEVVREQRDLLRKLLPNGAEFDVQTDSNALTAEIDVVALQSILFSFALNAREALGYGGRVTLTVRRRSAEAPQERGLVFAPIPDAGDCAEVIFTDNGCGISAEALPRIVDPHFSTHPRNQGAGLGLYNVKCLAETHGFGFSAASLPGKGTEMILVIPLNRELTDNV